MTWLKFPSAVKSSSKWTLKSLNLRYLRGAKKILTTNKVKASVCSYHRQDDIIKIKSIFINHGYKIATSDGYMVFIYDPKIWETADFRKGIVYAENY